MQQRASAIGLVVFPVTFVATAIRPDLNTAALLATKLSEACVGGALCQLIVFDVVGVAGWWVSVRFRVGQSDHRGLLHILLLSWVVVVRLAFCLGRMVTRTCNRIRRKDVVFHSRLTGIQWINSLALTISKLHLLLLLEYETRLIATLLQNISRSFPGPLTLHIRFRLLVVRARFSVSVSIIQSNLFLVLAILWL